MPRFVPLPAQPRGQSPSGQSQPATGNPLGFARMGTGLLGLGSRFVDSPNLATTAQFGSGLLGALQGGMQIGQGHPGQGSVSLLGGLGNVGGATGRFLRLPALATGGSLLGSAAGTLGAGLDFARGNIPGGVQNLLSAGGTFANLAPPGATLGGVPLSTAGGTSAGLAASEAGIGLGGGAPLTGGASLAGAAGALAIPFVVGSIIENAVNAGLGEGAFGQTPLPFGRGNNFSSADNLASQLSQFRGIGLANQVQDRIQHATTPFDLLDLASMGRNPNWSAVPTGEIQVTHTQTPTPEAFNRLITQVAQSNDPALLRQFISGLSIQSGEGGATRPNYQLTDWWRRKLVSLLPATHPLRQDMTGLFEAPPANLSPDLIAQRAAQNYAQLVQQTNDTGRLYPHEALVQNLVSGTGGHERGLSPLFRTPAEVGVSDARARELLAQAFASFGLPFGTVPPVPPTSDISVG